jgi:hypothetical protein
VFTSLALVCLWISWPISLPLDISGGCRRDRNSISQGQRWTQSWLSGQSWVCCWQWWVWMCSESPVTQSPAYQCMMDIWISQLWVDSHGDLLLLLSGSFATVLDFCSQSHNTSHLFGSHTPSLTLCGSPSVAGPPCSSSTDHGVAGTVNTYKQPNTITIFIPYRQT